MAARAQSSWTRRRWLSRRAAAAPREWRKLPKGVGVAPCVLHGCEHVRDGPRGKAAFAPVTQPKFGATADTGAAARLRVACTGAGTGAGYDPAGFVDADDDIRCNVARPSKKKKERRRDQRRSKQQHQGHPHQDQGQQQRGETESTKVGRLTDVVVQRPEDAQGANLPYEAHVHAREARLGPRAPSPPDSVVTVEARAGQRAWAEFLAERAAWFAEGTALWRLWTPRVVHTHVDPTAATLDSPDPRYLRLAQTLHGLMDDCGEGGAQCTGYST